MTNVLTYGTFDLFHYGHERILTRANEMCNNLFVGVSTDSFNMEKGKTSCNKFSTRANDVRLHVPNAHVFPENSFQQKVIDVKRFNIDLFVMGDDWRGKFDWLKDICEVKYLPRTVGISTTLLKARLANSQQEKLII
ncbi:adenylyltransferase/cytidyltransferase family protein [Alphaproteobacteria bacterium LSUCC0684]